VLALVVAAAAAGVRAWFAARGALRPIDSAAEPSDDRTERETVSVP
jgi:Flp pilus assembly protein CpaB